MAGNRRKTSFSLAEKCGVLALVTSVGLSFVCWYLALLPLVAFLGSCAIAPFLHSFGFFLPIISRGRVGEEGIALTFDDGPDPSSTPVVLKLLAKYHLTATFFVVGKRVADHPELIREIVRQGHSLGNHSWDHDYGLMLRSQARLQQNVRKTQEVLRRSGVVPHVFRPPMGITGSRLGRVLEREDLVAVNYSCRALDRGNRQIDKLAKKILRNVRPGAIVMLHDLPPAGTEQMNYWQHELDTLFMALSAGYSVKPLDRIIGRPVMTRIAPESRESL